MNSVESGQQHAALAPAFGCRSCGAPVTDTFVDLGMSPLCQTHISVAQLDAMEAFYPLHALVCPSCFLVQLKEYVAPGDIFSEYAYFSSYSDSWVDHARRYAAHMQQYFGIHSGSLVMEIASNDGYLLQHFVASGVPVLGIEPAANVAKEAIARGVRTEVAFFGVATARDVATRFGKPDLLLGNNVLAHVPDINDFVGGMKELVAPRGVITMEFPHLLRLMEQNQFDTIYHEHFSYLSWGSVCRVFERHGLVLFDVEELSTHGGSLRIYGRHASDNSRPVTDRARDLLQRELAFGMQSLSTYAGFGEQVRETKRNILEFLIAAKRQNKSIVGYGAPGKGNTLLNYCGIRQDFLDYTVDRNPYKQGKYTPGTHIPIRDPAAISETRPDYVLILPWNLKDEIVSQLAYIRDWGGKFVVPIPRVQVF
jgi:SAM-dependent methyltransferase